MASTLGIFHERVHSVLTHDLGTTKNSALCVPRLFTAVQKRMRFKSSRENLQCYDVQPVNLVGIFVAMDEI